MDGWKGEFEFINTQLDFKSHVHQSLLQRDKVGLDGWVGSPFSLMAFNTI